MARKFLPTNRKLVDYEVAIALVYLLVMHILSFKLERQAPSWREFVFRVFLFNKKYRLFYNLAVLKIMLIFPFKVLAIRSGEGGDSLGISARR